MRSINPNIRVDPDLEDEKGFTTDLGLRGNIKHILNYDASIFLLNYNNRIGTVLRYDSTLFNVYRFRTNISQSLNYGFESFAELDIWRLIKRDKAKAQISIFSNCSLIDARYVNSKESAYENKKVELVPNILLKTGLTVKKGKFSGTWQYSFVSSQYTDATNTIQSANAINGLIPAYYVMDLSLSYKYKYLTFYGTVNNLTNNMYFTRRSEAYPGPGIVPSDGIGVYLTVQVKI